jgi:predicted metallopeptidase
MPGRFGRMEIPKSGEDVERISQEVSGEYHAEHQHEGEEALSLEDAVATAVHMLSHLEAQLASISGVLREIDSKLSSVSRYLAVLAKLMLLREVKSGELRDRLIREIAEALSE